MIKKMLIVITLVFITFSAGCVTRFINNFKTGEFSAKENDKYYALTVTEITKDDYNVANGKNVVLDDITNKYYLLSMKYRPNYFEAWTEIDFHNLKNISTTTKEPVCYSDDNNNTIIPHNKKNSYAVSLNNENLTLLECTPHVMSNGYINNNKIYFSCANCGKIQEEDYHESDYLNVSFIDYPGGCLMFSFNDYVKTGEAYYFDYVKEYMNAEAFIDLETLKIYSSSIEPNDNIELIIYNDGVTDNYIYSYILSHLDIEFKNSFYSLDDLKSYTYDLELGKVIINKDGIKYTFMQSQSLEDIIYLSMIEAKDNLFGKPKSEVEDILKVLYGSLTFESYQISVELFDEGYRVILAEPSING